MNRLLSVLLAVSALLIVLASGAQAKDLVWDRNSESDMKDYQVWACETPNCVVLKSAANLRATIPQTAVGVVPKWTLPTALLEGSLAVSARDQSLNESGLSVPVPFDQVAPVIPVNPRLQ